MNSALVKMSLACFLTSVGLPALQVPQAPQALRPDNAQSLLTHLKGKGKQIYVCQNASGDYAWKLKAPDAGLFDDADHLTGRHFAGPTWELNDGSKVIGQLAATVPAPDAGSIPWLLLTAKAHEGTGMMARVQSIQRLNTNGGVAPAGGCNAATAKEETAVAYQADYYFYGAAAAH